MKPPSEVTVLSLREPRELPLSLLPLLLEGPGEMLTEAIATSKLGLLDCGREVSVADWPTRELGGDGFALRVGLEVEARCLNGGGDPEASIGELTRPLFNETGGEEAVIVGRRELVLRRGSEPSRSVFFLDGELREKEERNLSLWSMLGRREATERSGLQMFEKDDGFAPPPFSNFVISDCGSCGLPPDLPFGIDTGGFLDEGEIRFKLVVELFLRSIKGIMGFLWGEPMAPLGIFRLSRMVLISGGIGTEWTMLTDGQAAAGTNRCSFEVGARQHPGHPAF